jgi:hypothetical protein
MGEPPVLPGAVHLAIADVALARDAVPMVGAPGTAAGVTALDRAEYALDPTAFVARTWAL